MPQPLSIVHVARSPVGGVFRHIADLSAAQTAAGHAVGLICDSTSGGSFEDERIDALAGDLALGVARLPMRRAIGPADLPGTLAVARRLGRMRPDVVHAHGAKGGLYGRLGAALLRGGGRRVVSFYAPHGGSLHYEAGSAVGRLYFTVERALECLTDGLIHVSAFEARTYREKVGAPRCPAHVVVNGLRPEEFEPVDLRPDAADFLYIGALRDLKGVDVFIRALLLLERQGRAFRAVLVGGGDASDERRYRDMVGEGGLADAVAFLPPMPARAAFALARTIVVPSRAESMPYIVLEATAAGAPIIATEVGGIPEILDGGAEALVAPGDPAALADALRGALATPQTMAAAAMLRRDRVKQKFSLAQMAARVEDIYRAALDERYREGRTGSALPAGFSR